MVLFQFGECASQQQAFDAGVVAAQKHELPSHRPRLPAAPRTAVCDVLGCREKKLLLPLARLSL